MWGVCSSLAVGECMVVGKVFTKVSQVSHCPKWNCVFCISYYISIYYLFYYNFYCLFGTVGQWDTWDTWYSFPLFSLSLAISLTSTFAMSQVIVFAIFTRTEV